jgi:hypothetical protein
LINSKIIWSFCFEDTDTTNWSVSPSQGFGMESKESHS